MREARHPRGLIDTSVVIDLERIDPDRLPETMAVSAITMAELAAGPQATDDADERGRRQDRLVRAAATFESVPFDDEAARAYGRVYAAVVSAGRKARGQRAFDLLIAATAIAEGLPLYTRNPADFAGLGDIVEVVTVAVRERLDRVRREDESSAQRRAVLLRKIADEAAPRWVEPYRSTDHGDILYDESGLPR